MVSFTNTCYSFDPRSRLGRHVESHRPNLFGSRALYTHPFYQALRRKYVTAHPTYTYISLTPTKYSYNLINLHLLLTKHILDNAQAPYLHADVIALLQLGTMYMTSSPGLVQLIPPTLKARSAHVRPPPYSIRFTDVAHYPSFLPNRTMAICRDIHYLHIHIPHSYQIFVLAY